MLTGLLVNGGSRALLVATPAVTLPLVTDGLGAVNYGAYAVVTAIVYFLPWVDLGVSLSMVTTVSQADGRGDQAGIRAVVSTGLAVLTAVGAGLVVVALALWAASRGRERRLEHRRVEAGEHRDAAGRRARQAEERELAARDELDRAERERAVARAHSSRADDIDPDVDTDR
jgi:hypothetical protein